MGENENSTAVDIGTDEGLSAAMDEARCHRKLAQDLIHDALEIFVESTGLRASAVELTHGPEGEIVSVCVRAEL